MTAASLRSRGGLAVLLFTVFIEMAGFGLIIPFLPFWAEHFGATADLVALLMSTYSACQFVSAFFWGWVSDRIGRKPILLISLAGSVVAYLWLAEAGALWALFAARALNGAMGGILPVAQAYVADLTAPEQRARHMGLLGATFGLGFILGPAIGALLAGSDEAAPDFATPFRVAAACSFAAFLLGLVLLRDPPRQAAPAVTGGIAARLRAFGLILATPAVALPIAVGTMLAFVMSGVESTFVLWTAGEYGWGPRQNGYLLAYIGLVLVLAQAGLVGRLADWLGEPRLAALGALLLAAGVAALPLAGIVPRSATLAVTLMGSTLIALGVGLGQPAIQSLTSRNAPADRQGAVLGAAQSASSLARIFGPAFAGTLFEAYGRHTPYLAGAVIMLLAFAVALRLPRQDRS